MCYQDYVQRSNTSVRYALVEKTEEAIRDGIQIERWRRDAKRQMKEFKIDLKPAIRTFELPNETVGYLATCR
jgi:hypothetical protein